MRTAGRPSGPVTYEKEAQLNSVLDPDLRDCEKSGSLWQEFRSQRLLQLDSVSLGTV